MKLLSARVVAPFWLSILAAFAVGEQKPDASRWDERKAAAWHAQQPYLVGCNFIPSSAVNQLEMWQADTFDPKTIDRELGRAADKFGFNSVRVYLHDLAWEADPKGFKGRLEELLRADGTVYDVREAEQFRKLTRRGKP